MTVFVDTSGLYALLDRTDDHHETAAAAWREIVEREDGTATHNYVIVETVALTQARLGLEAVRAVRERFVPVLGVVWVDEAIHTSAVTAVLASGKRAVSLVDRTSFEVMRRLGLSTAFTTDGQFAAEGFRTIP